MSANLPTSREFWAKAEAVFRSSDDDWRFLCVICTIASREFGLSADEAITLAMRERARLDRYRPNGATATSHWWPSKPYDQPLDMPRVMVLRALQCEDRL